MSVQLKKHRSHVRKQEQNLPRPTQFDELSSIFYPPHQQQETARVDKSTLPNNLMARSFSQRPSLNVSNTVEGLETAPLDHPIQVSAAAYHYEKPLGHPPGYRFSPNDGELIFDYLKPFLHGYPLPDDNVHLVNVYNYHPEQLAAKFKEGNDRGEWFFITERRKRFVFGTRPDRSANEGFWKAIGTSTPINAGTELLGHTSFLEFRFGKQPNGVKTAWMMQEYRVHRPPPNKKSHLGNKMLDTVLCKIYRTPMGRKRKAKEEEDREKYLPNCVSPFDELSAAFDVPSTSRNIKSSLNPNLEKGGELLSGMSPMEENRKT